MATPEQSKLWRLNNPEARGRIKKAYFARNRQTPGCTRNGGEPWTQREVNRITDLDRPADSVLSKELGRSIQAIQKARCLYRKDKLRIVPEK